MKPGAPIGFVGLGQMGGAIVERLLAAAMPVRVHDRDEAAIARMALLGATAAADVRDIAAHCDPVFTCLPDADACIEVASALRDGACVATHVECSTIGRAAIARVAAAHPRIATIDAPVSGGPKGARAGTLTAIVSGSTDAIAELRPTLERIAARVFVVGDRIGDAQIAKIVNNALSICAMVVSCEAVVLAVKAGLDATRLIEVINASTGRNSATMDKFPKAILPRTFDYGGALAIGSKDLALYMEEAAAEGLPAWSVSNAAQVWRVAVDRLGPDADLTALIRVMEEGAGVEVGAAAHRWKDA
jgi:3-hydroxyisobutyrate dehydrogenase-like beta-hydroxyacid dehydrogenase